MNFFPLSIIGPYHSYMKTYLYTCGISPEAKPTGRMTPPHAILHTRKKSQ